MIIIANKPADIGALNSEYSEDSFEGNIINILSSSEKEYRYDSIEQLKFELMLRKEIVKASIDLYNSRFEFRVFREAKCNPEYWELTSQGGFKLKDGVKASDAINDIFINSSMYGTECATAMVIVYYKALLSIFPEDVFNEMFPKITLMNWHSIDKNLREIGATNEATDFLPGDRRYFINPDVDPLTPEWQGENTIYLGNGLYYGHGIGVHKADVIIEELNKNRKEGSEQSAYLLDSVGRPNFKRLATLYYGNS